MKDIIEKENEIKSASGNESHQKDFIRIENKKMSIYYKREILCTSIIGLPLYLITIGKES